MPEFRRSIRSAVRGLWSGALSRQQFNGAMKSTIKRQLSVAWNEGAKECGILPDELAEDEISSRDDFIEEQVGYISGFADGIREGDRLSGGKLVDLFARAEMWINRYSDAKERSKSLACANQKLEWQLGPSEQHCRDCSKYNGKVYRGSVWGEITPQSPCLACKGYRCKCRRNVTTRRATRGKPSGMTGC